MSSSGRAQNLPQIRRIGESLVESVAIIGLARDFPVIIRASAFAIPSIDVGEVFGPEAHGQPKERSPRMR
jgi:hypothetical protein